MPSAETTCSARSRTESDAAHHYLLGSRTALEWIIDRYQVKTDKASGTVNDPNDWCDEHDDATYIVDLIKKVTTVSVRTVELVGQLAARPPNQTVNSRSARAVRVPDTACRPR